MGETRVPFLFVVGTNILPKQIEINKLFKQNNESTILYDAMSNKGMAWRGATFSMLTLFLSGYSSPYSLRG